MSEDKVIFCGNDEIFLQKELTEKSNEANGGGAFRIPSLINAGNTLIAAAVRQVTGDGWGYLELAIRRSEDGGESWTPVEAVATPPARMAGADLKAFPSAYYLNPCMAKSPDGEIIMLAQFFPECKDLQGRQITDKKKIPYSMYEHKMRPVLYDRDGKFYLIKSDGTVLNNKLKETLYKVTDNHGSLYKGEAYVGNIFLNGKTGVEGDESHLTFGAPLKTPKRSYIYMLKSSDKGKNWSEPVDITSDFLNAEDGAFISLSSGTGLTTQDGRVIMPLYIDGKENISIYTVDSGETWHRMTQQPYACNTNEWQAVQAPDGNILGIGSRREYGRCPLSISFDNGKHWEKAKPTELYSPNCQKSIISIGEYVFCSHPTESTRENGVITVGKFKKTKGKATGIDWHSEAEITDGYFGYSCITQINSEYIGVLYEAMPSSYICFKKFKIADLI